MTDHECLRIGVVQSVATRLVPPALRKLRRRDPGLAVELAETPCDRELFARVEAGELDAAFAELPLEPGPFEAVEVMLDPTVLLVQADSPLACAATRPRLADLARLPFIRIEGWPLLELIESQLRSAGVEPNFAMTAETNSTVQALVGAGCGAAILPRLAIDENDPLIAMVDLQGLLLPRRLALYWHGSRRRRETLEALAKAVASAAGELTRGFEAEGSGVRRLAAIA